MINEQPQLDALLERLRNAEWIAVDTEADSLHAYPEKLCLIQISHPAGDDLVDPLASLDLRPLWEEFSRHRLILHGADYDLRLFHKTGGFVPKAIFDTMIAARLLGCAQFGLASLVQQFLGIALEKGPQKANWARRPLTERMEDYARNDTRYLKPLSDMLSRQLEEKGRLGWLKESCDRLIADCSVPRLPDPENDWRIKGCFRLDRRGLAALRELWFWREAEATAANKPPYFILNHETMVALAGAAASGNPAEKLIPKHLSPRRRQGVMAALEEALALPSERLPEHVRTQPGQRLTEKEKQRYDRIQALRDKRAGELGIDPTLIASRATMVALAVNYDSAAADLMEWQRELLRPPGKG